VSRWAGPALLASVALLLPLALGACGGSFFQTKAAPPKMYLLSVPAPAAPPAAAPQIAADLSVLKPRVRAGLETDRIAVLYPDRRLEFFADVRWSGPLDEVIQELAVQEFRVHAGLRNVSADSSMFASDYWLEIEVADFQAEYSASSAAPVVRVRILARIGVSADRRILARVEADAEVTASDNRMSAIVEAYNRAADQALSELASRTLAALKSR
jgi:cholesterol transport system auxiliary component